MLISLTAPVLALLISIPGIGGLPGFKVKMPRKAAPADTLPPAWKSASRLAVENHFVFATLHRPNGESGGLKLPADTRQLRVDVDPDSDAISIVPEMGSISLGQGARHSFSTYSRDMTSQTFRRQWQERSRQNVNVLTQLGNTSAAPAPGLRLPIPINLPKQVQSFLGPGSPSLNISGSENITLSGQSNWTNQQTGPQGQQRSLFPSLDMQQNLDIRLEGQLSDRVKVNLLQNSGVQIPLANRIAINYRGDEDDLIQHLDLGNTNLSLPGTQYVSYSGKNEGLFGVKVASKLGPLDFTLLTSKQEGRSERANYAGGASRQSQPLRDTDYVKDVYFLLYGPSREGQAYEIPDSSIRLYLDDNNNYNTDIVKIRGRALVDPTPANLALANHPVDSVRLGLGPVSRRGNFLQLNPGFDQDYEILSNVYGPDFKVIKLKRPMEPNRPQVLAVTYLRRPAPPRPIPPNYVPPPLERVGGEVTLDRDDQPALTMKLLWVDPASMNTSRNPEGFDDSLAFTPVRDLQLRNFYQLPGQRIDPASLKITIRKGSEQPFRIGVTLPDGTNVPYIEVFGLDNFDELTGSPRPGHDAKIDGTLATSDSRLFVDYENGILFFYDPRPFAPRIGEGGRPFERYLSGHLNRRATIDPTGGNEELLPNAALYDKYNLQRDLDGLYFIDVDFTAQRASGEITLGRSNIVEGSEVVTINGQALVRDRDYSVDYDLGRVVLKRTLGPADNLNVDYSYAPLFQQAGKTLIGSAFRYEGRDKSFGGAFMYESKGAQDLRPRLGEEPSRSLIGDLNSDLAFRPSFLTRLVDRLPGVRTTAPSEFRIQAEVGASFPNPNTRNEVYVDDMEGVRDAVSVSMGPDRWRLSSVPSKPVIVGPGGRVTSSLTMLQRQLLSEPYMNGELHWYSPYAVVKEKELKPNLEEAQGANNSHQVLALSIPRRPCLSQDGDTLWAGLTYPLDQSGLDLSKSQFIELWVNDFYDVQRIRDRHVRLHVDLGTVSEDQMRAPNNPPNQRLDSEDQLPRDNQLVVTPGSNEDTGLDGLETPVEPDSVDDSVRSCTLPPTEPLYRDLVLSGPGDREGDDYRAPNDQFKEMDPRRWIGTNGTEANHLVLPYPDTEDLNFSNTLDIDENYFEYTIDLGNDDHPYLATDVRVEYAGDPDVTSTNGWRRYRIPIADTLRLQFGNPQLSQARHLRIWVEGLVDPDPPEDPASRIQLPILMLGGLEIVGSRWRMVELESRIQAVGTTATLNSVNTVDNADRYVAPFDPGETRTGSQALTRREQSIALEFTQLAPDDTVEAFRSFSIDEDYSRYGKLNWFVTGHGVQGPVSAVDSLNYFVRFGSDERSESYYEIRAQVPTAPAGVPWREVKLDLTEISGLKFDPAFGQRDSTDTLSIGPLVLGPDTLVRPLPSDPRITVVIKGRPSFTRLRRVSFGLINPSTQFVSSGELWFNELRAAEVAKDRGRAQRVNMSGTAANLLSYQLTWDQRDADFLSVGETRGLGSTSNNINLGTRVDLHRFFEATGIVLPVNFGYQRSLSQPRFNAGDDVVRTGALSEASESYAETRNWSASYTRTWSERSNPFLRYTLGGITASMNYTDGSDHNPNTLTRRTSRAASVNYRISPRRLLAIPVPFTKTKLMPLPDQFYWNYDVGKDYGLTADRLRDGGVRDRDAVSGRRSGIRFGADTRPFESFTHHFEGVRNLMLPGSPQHLGFLHLGKVVSWNQTMSTRFSLNRGTWLNPTFNWSSRYNQDNGPQLSPDLSVRAVSNGQTVSMGWVLPFDRLAPKPAVRDSAGKVISGGGSPLKGWLSRLGSIQTDASMLWGSGSSRLRGTPNLLYLSGLSQEPGPKGIRGFVTPDFGNVEDRSFEWRTNARTRVMLLFDASVQAGADFNSQRREMNAVESRKDQARFPDLAIDYGKVANFVGLSKFLQNPRLRTVYNNVQTTDYGNGIPRGRSYSSQWLPMLSLNGDLKSGARIEMLIERRITKTERLQLGKSTTTDRNTDVSLSINRSYSQGQKVSLLGKETTVKSTVNLGLSTKFEKQSGETAHEGTERTSSPVNRDRLSVNGTGSYGFSNNVTGNLELGFGQDRDLRLNIVRRNVRVQLRASFTF